MQQYSLAFITLNLKWHIRRRKSLIANDLKLQIVGMLTLKTNPKLYGRLLVKDGVLAG